MIEGYEDVHWEGVNEFQARQTRAMDRYFCSSRPKPSEQRMGFRRVLVKGEAGPVNKLKQFLSNGQGIR